LEPVVVRPISFLSSTPQTGVDSILATYGLFGWVFTVIKLVVALLCGLVSGILVDIFCKQNEASLPEIDNHDSHHAPTDKKSISASLRYFFVELPLDLYKPLLIGIFVAGLINNFLPSDFFAGTFSSGIVAFIGITLISLPLYVCAVESLPLAFAFLSAGISPGAVLVFLIVGPASNSATILATLKIIGKQATIIYIATLVVIAWSAGYLMNLFLDIEISNFKEHHAHLSIWHHISASVLLAYFLNAVLCESFFWRKKPMEKDCHIN
jgi:uncharacterized membrane protein YraQ (UPF0718 family)